jgi:hypothetical protein
MRVPSTAALLSGVIDYAGLFPPAGLSMASAVEAYGDALAGPSAWMLGRFVTPAARLPELREALNAVPAASDAAAWRVSAIVGGDGVDDLDHVATFNADRTRGQRVAVDSIESKPASLDGIDWLADRTRAIGDVYIEMAPGPDADAWLARVAVHGLRAKVRTGGLTPDAFPSPALLAGFLAAAMQHGVPFKATAGLHHAVRGDYRLTYEPDSASAPMYGYLNVLLATSALESGEPVAVAEAILQQSDAAAFSFAADAVHWGDREFSAAHLRATRARRLVSFGSCSFHEPVEEFTALAARSLASR